MKMISEQRKQSITVHTILLTYKNTKKIWLKILDEKSRLRDQRSAIPCLSDHQDYSFLQINKQKKVYTDFILRVLK